LPREDFGTLLMLLGGRFSSSPRELLGSKGLL